MLIVAEFEIERTITDEGGLRQVGDRDHCRYIYIYVCIYVFREIILS